MLCDYSAEAEEKFRVAAIMPLTGPLAEYGVAAKNGIELAQKEHPENFRHIQFAFDDNQYDGMRTLSSYRKQRETTSLFYVWGYGPNQALVPVAEVDGSPVVAVSSDRSVAHGRNYITRFGYTHEHMAEVLMAYARKHDLHRLGIIKTELAYINSITDAMKALLKKDESLEVIASVDMATSDFRTEVLKLKAQRFDAIGVFLTGEQGVQFYRQAKQVNYQPKTFSLDFFDSESVAEQAGGAMDGVDFVAPTQRADFQERYRKVFGNDLQSAWAAMSYEFAMLVGNTFDGEAHKLSAKQVVDRLRAGKAESRGAAEYSYENPNGSPGFVTTVSMKRIEKERIVPLTK